MTRHSSLEIQQGTGKDLRLKKKPTSMHHCALFDPEKEYLTHYPEIPLFPLVSNAYR